MDGIIDIAHGRGAFILGQSPKQLRPRSSCPAWVRSNPASFPRRCAMNSAGCQAPRDGLSQPCFRGGACLERILNENYNSAIIYPTMEGESVRTIPRMMVDGFPARAHRSQLQQRARQLRLCPTTKGRAALATRHLLERGCKHIACVTTDFPNVITNAGPATSKPLAEYGVRLEADLIVELPHAGDLEENATQKLLATHKNVDGIFYYNDYQALIGMKQIRQAGLKIPSDIRRGWFRRSHPGPLLSEPTLTPPCAQNHEVVRTRSRQGPDRTVQLPPLVVFRSARTPFPSN